MRPEPRAGILFCGGWRWCFDLPNCGLAGKRKSDYSAGVAMNSSLVKPSISFIVLALNEAEHIEATIMVVLEAVVASVVTEYELVLVNDGSTDRTGELMDKAACHNPRLRVVHNEHNLGFGGAYKRGVAVARGDYVMIVAGDNAMPAASISTILNRLGETDIVFPYVIDAKDRSLLRRIGSRGFTAVINALFGQRIRYYNSMVPRRELLNQVTIKTDGYASQAEGALKLIKAGCSYLEVGVAHGHASGGGSSAVSPKNLLKALTAVVALIKEMRQPSAVLARVPIEPKASAEER